MNFYVTPHENTDFMLVFSDISYEEWQDIYYMAVERLDYVVLSKEHKKIFDEEFKKTYSATFLYGDIKMYEYPSQQIVLTMLVDRIVECITTLQDKKDYNIFKNMVSLISQFSFIDKTYQDYI